MSQENNSVSKILSGVGGEHEVSDELRKYVCYYEDGRLLVSQTHLANVHVMSYVAMLGRLKKPVNKTPTDMEGVRIAYEQSSAYQKELRPVVDETRMMQCVNDLLVKGVAKRASDIHIRVGKRYGTRIWFRVHGDMLSQEDHIEEYGTKLCSTIYQVMTDVSDTAFKPNEHQDARIANLSEIAPELEGVRVATSPTVDGHMMVLRLLYNDANNSTDLTALGWSEYHKDSVKLMKARPTGLNIVCGPTGSGKSTTLQRILTGLIAEKNQTINVITVEDPPEYPIPGANQTPVVATGEDRASGFQSCITGAMRLDPDVIMISEVRDPASAEAAFRAAMTGHQVWTTLHANSAPAIIDRLIDIGLPLSLLADHNVVTGLMCQRLVKVLCPHCKVPMVDNTKLLDSALVDRVMRAMSTVGTVYIAGDGCDKCGHTGTKGRTALVETIIPDTRFMQYIREGKKTEAIEYWTKVQKGVTLLGHAISKIQEGLIDPRAAELVAGPLTLEMMLDDGRLDKNEITEAVTSRNTTSP